MDAQPSLREFRKQLKRGNVIPVSIELPADLQTPVSVFLKLARNERHAFLLESVELGEKIGRYSLIGMDAHAILEYSSDTAKMTHAGRTRTTKSAFLDAVKQMMNPYRFVRDPSLPQLVGGLVGYIGYELVQQFETIRLRRKRGLPFPDAVLFVPTNLAVFDHIKHSLKLIHLAMVNGSPLRSYQRAVGSLKTMSEKLRRSVDDSLTISEDRRPETSFQPRPVRSNVTKKQFESMVKKAKQYIRAGECIQIVLSQRFDLGTVTNDFKLYRTLRSLNPSPYMFYFRYRHLSLVGSSPEMLSKKTGRVTTVRPIAGTRPRGRTDQEDTAYEAAMRRSPKEMAEHLMLVDLGRNDLGRVCQTKSVRVDDFAKTERYSHVMHLVSSVTAKLKKGKNALDLLRATFPAGTVTGAPKIRAMEIIDELESDKRGPYAGSLGYFSLTGDMDMCITIRTIVVYRKRAYVQAGAGIVNDSIPRNEYRETINKAKALLQSVEIARR